MRPALRRVWWGLGAATLAVMLWFIWSGRVRVQPGPPRVTTAVPAATPAEASALAASSPTGAAGRAAHSSGEIEVCGGAWVKSRPDGTIDDDDFKRVVNLPEARARMLDELRADPDEFARAAAIWLSVFGAEPLGPAEGGKNCEPDQCEAQRKYAALAAQSRDELARTAATTRDPRVYALAFNVCGGARLGDSACQLLSAEQWARLDPGNAAPWMYVLGQAVDRRDMSAQNEALHRIATSSRSDLRYLALSGLVLDHMPNDDAASPAALTLTIETIGIEVAFTHPGFQLVAKVCKGAPLRDWNRRESCSAVAELLVERADTLFERGLGVRIGTQIGWTTERIQRLSGEEAAYVASLTAPGAFAGTNACADIRRDLETVRRRARLGEAGALREWVARSGKTAEDFIRVEREGRARIAADAASAAASAASAAR